MLGIVDRPDDADANAIQGLVLARESGDDALIADALIVRSGLAVGRSDSQAAFALAIEALAHAHSAGDPGRVAVALMARANAVTPVDAADDAYREAADALRSIGDQWHLMALNVSAAYRAIIRGRYVDAARLLDETLPLAREVNDAWGLLLVWGNLGLVRLFTGDDEGARFAFAEQLRVCRDENIRQPAAEGLAGLAAISAHRHHFERAAHLLGAATALGDIGHQDVIAKLEQQFFGAARSQLGDRLWSEAMQTGGPLPFQNAVALALAEPGSSTGQ